MKEQLEQRSIELQAELEVGQKALAGTNAQIQQLQATARETTVILHRIGGAIQVLKEELLKAEGQEDEDKDKAP